MSRGTVTDLEGYRARFAGVSDEKAVGEATVTYLHVPQAASRIKRYVPDTSRRHNVSGIPKSRALYTIIKKPNSLKTVLKPFLPEGLRQRISAHLHHRNLNGAPPMPEEIREKLTETYQEDILKLQGLIGRDLSGWLGKKA
jgi:hypothetical protein